MGFGSTLGLRQWFTRGWLRRHWDIYICKGLENLTYIEGIVAKRVLSAMHKHGG